MKRLLFLSLLFLAGCQLSASPKPPKPDYHGKEYLEKVAALDKRQKEAMAQFEKDYAALGFQQWNYSKHWYRSAEDTIDDWDDVLKEAKDYLRGLQDCEKKK